MSVGSTALSVTVSALGGYAFARYDFKGKNLSMSTILALFMIPVVINIIPLYIMLANVGLLNSLVSSCVDVSDSHYSTQYFFAKELL